MSWAGGRVPTSADLVQALGCGRRCPCAAAVRRGFGLVHCPSHDDEHPSLVVHERDGRVLVNCKAGCAQAAVLQALRERGLWPAAGGSLNSAGGGETARRSAGNTPAPGHGAPSSGPAPAGAPTRTRRTAYRYIDEHGELLARHLREDAADGGKRVWWADEDGRPSKGGIRPERLPLYRLPQLLRADPAEPVLLVEGEKCAEAAAAAGAVAVSLAGGASQREFGTALAALRGREVVLWPDHDTPGQDLMHAVADSLAGVAAAVRWVEPLGLPDSFDNLIAKGYDVANWLAEGHDSDDLRRVLERAGPVPPRESPPPDGSAAALPPVPPFPLHVLPREVRALVEQGAAALDCPPDLLAGPALAFTAACLGDRFSIVVKEGWTERAIVWIGVVAVPGSAKSPAMAMVQRALRVLQLEARDLYRLLLAEFERALAAWAADRKNAGPGERPERPEVEHYYTIDSTPEAIARILGHPQTCTAGLVIIRDELVGFVRGFDAYKGGRGGERQSMLSLWAGSEFKSDRAGREPYFILDPTVSIAGGIQPEMLGALQAEAGQRDGFIERFLFCYPDTRPMGWTDAIVPQATIDAVTAVWRRLRRETGPGPVGLSPEALALFRTWVNDNARAQGELTGLLRGVSSKLPAQAARLALILHALAHPSGPAAVPVSGDTMAAALDLAEYFRAHAARTFAHFGETVSGLAPLAMRVLRLLRGHDRWLSRTELRDLLGRNVRSADLTSALGSLHAAGLAKSRPLPPGEKGGRPGEEWRATAAVTDAETAETAETQGAGEVSAVSAVSAHGSAGDEEAFEL